MELFNQVTTGDTAQQVVTAALKQFESENVNVEVFSLVRDNDLIEDIIHRAADDEALIVHTMVSAGVLTTLLHTFSRRLNLCTCALRHPKYLAPCSTRPMIARRWK